MKIWGYLLIVLNIAASGAFIYFGTQVWKARTEWQYALLKQELVNRGLPVEPPAARPPEDLEENHVPFEFQFGGTALESIHKQQLAKLIPTGGEPLGVKPGTVVTNQTDEVKRVEKIIFAEIESAKQPQKRNQLLLLLLNLSKGMGREGVFALLRDFPDDRRLPTARRELAFLGRTAPQVGALLAMNGVAEAQSGFAPNVSPEDKAKRIRAGRDALIGWAMSEISQATPEPLPSSKAPRAEEDEKPVKTDRDRLTAAMMVIKTEMEAEMPTEANLEAGRKQLLALLEGEEAIRGEVAKALIPFMAQIGTNPLDSEEKIAEAKQKLLELLLSRATTEAEKKSLTATVQLMMQPRSEEADKEKLNANIDTAAIELLRAYFEEAVATPSTDLPPDDAQARAKLAALKPIRDPDQKRLDIAHLLYHLDANLGMSKEAGDVWLKTFDVAAPRGDDAAADPVPKSALPGDDVVDRRTKWHQRVMAVVGLEGYVPVVEAQATELNGIYQRLQTRIMEEQNHFETEYQGEVLEVIDLAHQLGVRNAAVKVREMELAEHTRQLAVREVEKKELEDRLVAVTAAAKMALQNLDLKVDELFQITKQLGEAQDSLGGLERRLRDLEMGPADKKKN